MGKPVLMFISNPKKKHLKLQYQVKTPSKLTSIRYKYKCFLCIFVEFVKRMITEDNKYIFRLVIRKQNFNQFEGETNSLPQPL